MGAPSGGRLNRDVWEVEKEAPRQLLSSLPLQEAACPSFFLPLYLFPLFLSVFPSLCLAWLQSTLPPRGSGFAKPPEWRRNRCSRQSWGVGGAELDPHEFGQALWCTCTACVSYNLHWEGCETPLRLRHGWLRPPQIAAVAPQQHFLEQPFKSQVEHVDFLEKDESFIFRFLLSKSQGFVQKQHFCLEMAATLPQNLVCGRNRLSWVLQTHFDGKSQPLPSAQCIWSLVASIGLLT